MVDYPPGLKHCRFVSRGLIQLGPMVALLLVGASLMTAHHFFYAYLNEKSLDPTAAELPPVLQNQNNINFVGTTIAHGARIMLSMAIGMTFAQRFWETLRSRSHTIGQIDALVNCGQSPFRPSTLRAAKTSIGLFSISLIASATALVVVLSPGFLDHFLQFSTQQDLYRSVSSSKRDEVQLFLRQRSFFLCPHPRQCRIFSRLRFHVIDGLNNLYRHDGTRFYSTDMQQGQPDGGIIGFDGACFFNVVKSVPLLPSVLCCLIICFSSGRKHFRDEELSTSSNASEHCYQTLSKLPFRLSSSRGSQV